MCHDCSKNYPMSMLRVIEDKILCIHCEKEDIKKRDPIPYNMGSRRTLKNY
jgi:hypothetical protein